jgi:hypothetical protein
MKKYFIMILTVSLLFFVSFAYSEITVVSTKGDAAYMSGGKWSALSKGQKLQEGAKISTGAKSSVVLKIDGTTLTINQLTTIKLSSKDNIGLKYGSVRAKVKQIGAVRTKFRITTPVATSSVRGTEEIVSYGPKAGMVIMVIEGSVEGSNDKGVGNRISGRNVFHLKPDNARSDSLLSNIKDGATVRIFADNVTSDEKKADLFFRNQLADGGQTLIPGRIPSIRGNGTVSMIVYWP